MLRWFGVWIIVHCTMYGVTNRVTEVTKPVTHERKFDAEAFSGIEDACWVGGGRQKTKKLGRSCPNCEASGHLVWWGHLL